MNIYDPGLCLTVTAEEAKDLGRALLDLQLSRFYGAGSGFLYEYVLVSDGGHIPGFGKVDGWDARQWVQLKVHLERVSYDEYRIKDLGSRGLLDWYVANFPPWEWPYLLIVRETAEAEVVGTSSCGIEVQLRIDVGAICA